MRQLYIGRWVKGFRKFYELGRKFNLSPEAQHRLLVITYYFNKSNQNADKTARYFGLHRNTINNWLQLYDPNDLIKLEPNNPQYLMNLALAYAYLSEDDQAISLANQIKELKADDQASVDAFIQDVRSGKFSNSNGN